MSLWRRLKDRLFGDAEGTARENEEPSGSALDEAAGAAPAGSGARTGGSSAPSPPANLVVGMAETDAIAVLRRVRGTLLETDAVAEVLAAMGQRDVPEAVRVACADILAARGDEQGALRLLEGGIGPARLDPVASTAGLILAADLYASLGQLPRALGAVERVLAREIDAPGALERHTRWRTALGALRAPVGRLDEVTMVAPAAQGGPYRLLREVARGGSGTVYEAEDEVLGRRVGFKVYHGRGGDRAHLTREARLSSVLAGPGVVRVFDADPAEGWIALEWISRGSVRDVLRGGDAASLAPMRVWARPLARAIARIHGHGYVHADVKPANVLLRRINEPILGDFGSAKPMGAPAEGGSPGYVSPERLSGRASDPRDDIYGFGRILEDVLVRLAPLGVMDLEPWRALAHRCIGPDELRPPDGPALLREIA